MPFLGAHLSIAGGLHKAVEAAVALDCTTVQIFTKNSNQWTAKPLTDDEIGAFRKAVRAAKLKYATAHDSYLINLAAPADDLYRKSIDAFRHEVERAERWFRHQGAFFVFLGRMLPTVRSLVSVPAGLLQMRFRTFLIASTVGTAGWTAMLAFAGFKLRENFSDIDEWLGPLSNAILLTLAIGYLWRLWTYRPPEKS